MRGYFCCMSPQLERSISALLTLNIMLPLCFVGGYPAPGVNHVVIRERQRDDGGDVALGMLAGAATGLALGSLFSVF